ncbi:hypothetical protein KIH74_15490 [Kineosporia sp. J2-2]|uniref:Dolichyl-phosphate-mannose-protein mannosyltransferase n=1 Tax=Kineosporia corallincola TaxID=2835133 RepID=A0ABS5TGX9_9ACTN|nr:hypothetical protein [Kineosporia corallincola]MBT0770345.1 hypothetical protein [Kineosporia corallincola]
MTPQTHDVPDERPPGSRGERLSGVVLARSGPLAACFLAFTGLLAAVLVPFGGWIPWLVVPLLVIALAASVRLVRFVPATAAPAWVAPAVVAIAAGHGVWAALTHAEHVVLRRDAGSYALYTQWIATRHGLPIPSWLEAFGGSAALTDPAFRLSSPAYYQVVHGSAGAAGTSVDIVPQFLLGAPSVYSLGWWAAGWNGVLVMPAICSALAMLGFAGLVARLLGPRWAVLATAALVLSQPVLHAARSTYSEPIALLLVTVACALLADAVTAGNPLRVKGFLIPGVHGTDDPRLARRIGLAAGLAFGLAGLFRIDGLREVSLLLPVAAVLALRRHPATRPLVLGALGSTAVAAIPAVWLSRPYLGTISASLIPLIGGGVVLGLGSLAVVLVARRLEGRPAPALGARLTSPAWQNRWPWLLAGATALVGVVLAARPLFMITRQDPDDPGSRVVAGLQLLQGLAVDGGRTYAEHSLNWISWYAGPVVVIAGWLVFAALAAAVGRWWLNSAARGSSSSMLEGRTAGVPFWLGPAVIAFGSTLLTLYRPGITPDHPWADRRMVTMVIPAFVVAATAAATWVTRRVRRSRPWAGTGAVAVAAVVLLLPPWLATQPLAGQRTEKGEVAAVQKVCAELGANDVVLALDNRAANEWPQVVRGVCDRPSASVKITDINDTAAVAEVVRPIVARIAAAGNRPVLLAGTPEGEAVIEALGLTSRQVVDLETIEDQRHLTRVPDGEDELDIDVWLADATGVS